MVDKNKLKYGLKNTHYAVISTNNGVVTYGTPKLIPGSVNLVLNPSGDPVIFYADDIEYHREAVNDGYEGTLEVALIPDEFRIDVLGEELDANGLLVENVDKKPKEIALMYEFDGDVNRVRHVNYRVIVSRPAVEGSTHTNTKEPKTEVMDIASKPAIDTKDVKGKITQGQPGYDSFFDAVMVKSAIVEG